jgi:hypothetical protein
MLPRDIIDWCAYLLDYKQYYSMHYWLMWLSIRLQSTHCQNKILSISCLTAFLTNIWNWSITVRIFYQKLTKSSLSVAIVVLIRHLHYQFGYFLNYSGISSVSQLSILVAQVNTYHYQVWAKYGGRTTGSSKPPTHHHQQGSVDIQGEQQDIKGNRPTDKEIKLIRS